MKVFMRGKNYTVRRGSYGSFMVTAWSDDKRYYQSDTFYLTPTIYEPYSVRELPFRQLNNYDKSVVLDQVEKCLGRIGLYDINMPF